MKRNVALAAQYTDGGGQNRKARSNLPRGIGSGRGERSSITARWLATPRHTEGTCLKRDALRPFSFYNGSSAVSFMLVLIDESGDCGLKFGEGSSRLFVCVAVVFSDAFSSDACDRAINGLRFQLRKPVGFEFHFSESSNKIRNAFFGTVSHENFKYAGFVVDKARLYGDRFKDPKQVYEFSVGIVCEQVRPLLDNSKIIIDRNGNRDFRLRLEKGLKRQMTNHDGSCLIKKVTMEASHSNNLVQLADMISGAVMRSCGSGDDRFRDLVRSREKFVQSWPN